MIDIATTVLKQPALFRSRWKSENATGSDPKVWLRFIFTQCLAWNSSDLKHENITVVETMRFTVHDGQLLVVYRPFVNY